MTSKVNPLYDKEVYITRILGRFNGRYDKRLVLYMQKSAALDTLLNIIYIAFNYKRYRLRLIYVSYDNLPLNYNTFHCCNNVFL